jgi:hypothetical protein
VAEPDPPVGRIDILSEEELHELLVLGNETVGEPLFGEVLDEWRANHPGPRMSNPEEVS